MRELDEAAEVARDPESPVAELEDLECADGFAAGTPTRFRLVSAEVKRFLDQAGPLWQRGALADKAATGFTGAHTAHGGHETTVASLDNVFTHWGASSCRWATPNPSRSRPATPGSSWSFQEGSGPDEATLTVARHRGSRLARVAALLRGESRVAEGAGAARGG